MRFLFLVCLICRVMMMMIEEEEEEEVKREDQREKRRKGGPFLAQPHTSLTAGQSGDGEGEEILVTRWCGSITLSIQFNQSKTISPGQGQSEKR